MKILTYNVRSWYRDIKAGPLNWKNRAECIRAVIEREAPDVLLLQEAIFPMTNRCVPEGYYKASRGSISHHVFVRRGYAEVVKREWHIHWTRVRLRLANASRWDVVSVHGHWDKGKALRLANDLKDIHGNGASLIAGGDWNNEPATMRPLLFPYAVAAPSGCTFRNWKSGKEAKLDYFAGNRYAVKYGARIPASASFSDSDHLPVVIELL